MGPTLRPVGASTRLAQLASQLGYDDVAEQVRSNVRVHQAAEAQEEAEREEAAARRSVASAAANAGRLWCESWDRDQRSQASSDGGSGSSSTDGSSSAANSKVVRVGAARRGGRPTSASSQRSGADENSQPASSTTSRGGKLAVRPSSDWYVASAGPYLSPRSARVLAEKQAKAKFVGGSKGFVSAFGKASAIPLREPGGVAAAGRYYGKPAPIDSKLARRADPIAPHQDLDDDAMRRPKNALPWRPVADRRPAAAAQRTPAWAAP